MKISAAGFILNFMLRLIPPFLFLICVFLMTGLHLWFPIENVIESPFNYSGIALFAAGAAVIALVRRQFSRAQTEIHTFKMPVKLMTNGFFAVSRNPLYLGFCLMLAGLWLSLGSISPALGFLLFFLVADYWYIPHEEKNLERQFKGEYLAYRNRVRRWL